MQLGRSFDKNVLWENMERMSLWMDEYKSVSISEWTTRRDRPETDHDGHDLQKQLHMQIGLYVMQCFIHQRFTTA